MIISVIVFALLVLFMLAGVFPVQGGMQVAIFHTPVFMLLMLVLCILLMVCCRKRLGPTLRNLGFQLTHLGIIVILAGALTSYLAEKKSEFALPISPSHEVRELPTLDGNSSYALNFGVAVTNFIVDFYDQSDRRSNPTPKHYQASLKITSKDGSTLNCELEVNHPVEHAGWRFYLMSYDMESRRYVVLSARKDPGRNIVFGGIAMLMIGIATMCFRNNGSSNAAI